jgi:hypothetical protein
MAMGDWAIPGPSLFEVTPTGLAVREWRDLAGVQHPTYNEWAAFGDTLRHIQSALQLAVGDWLLYGEYRWHDEIEQAIEWTQRKVKTARNWRAVCKAVPASRRREPLTYSHYEAVAALKPYQQDIVLGQAVEGNWTVERTRERRRELLGEDAGDIAALAVCPCCHSQGWIKPEKAKRIAKMLEKEQR